jgi:hypothetical protein
MTKDSKKLSISIKYATKYLPLFYVILVFLGYLNMQMFYSYFGIPINSYISLNDIILSFLPIIIQLCLIALLGVIVFVIYKNDTEKSNEEYIVMSFNNLFRTKTWKQKESRIKKFWAAFGEFFNLLIRIGFYAYFGLRGVYLIKAIFAKKSVIYENYADNVWLIIILLGMLYPLIDKIIIKIMKEINSFHFIEGYRMIILRYLIGYFIINSFANYSSSVRIEQGKPEYLVEFKSRDSEIKSDSSFVFLGKTHDFLFMRDLPASVNHIYPINEIYDFKMRKLALIKTPITGSGKK